MKVRNTLVVFGIAAVFSACTSIPSQARECEFAWDRNPEPEVNEYRIEIRDAISNAVLKSVILSDNPATIENDTPITVVVPEYPLKATKIVAFAVIRSGDSSMESLPSEELTVEALLPGQVKNVRRVLGGAAVQSAAPARVIPEKKRKIGN